MGQAVHCGKIRERDFEANIDVAAPRIWGKIAIAEIFGSKCTGLQDIYLARCKFLLHQVFLCVDSLRRIVAVSRRRNSPRQSAGQA
jgi:hypothetical protein